jgi:hypothetical protein
LRTTKYIGKITIKYMEVTGDAHYFISCYAGTSTAEESNLEIYEVNNVQEMPMYIDGRVDSLSDLY